MGGGGGGGGPWARGCERLPKPLRLKILKTPCNPRPSLGTLFRFPLRTPAAAARSEIKPEPYDPAAARALLEAFRTGAADALLFLKCAPP